MTDATEHVLRHPAPFSKNILGYLDVEVPPGIFLDPFAGTGRIFDLIRHVPDEPDLTREFVGVELEPEWAALDRRTICADFFDQAKEWRREGLRFDGVVTSPVYGNRMSDHHDAADPSLRRSYTHDLGRKLSEGNVGNVYFWQDEYKDFHRAAWKECYRLVRPGGLMFLNVSNFIRRRRQVPVVPWHRNALRNVGWVIDKCEVVGTPRMRYGENNEARVDGECVIRAHKPKGTA